MKPKSKTQPLGQIEKLLPRHNRIIDLALAGTFNYKQIAEIVGVSAPTVRNVLSSPTAQHELAMRRDRMKQHVDVAVVRDEVDTIEAARKSLAEAAQEAADKLIAIMQTGESGVARGAANDILDRVGVARVSRNETDATTKVLVLDAETALRLQQTIELENAISNNENAEN